MLNKILPQVFGFCILSFLLSGCNPLSMVGNSYDIATSHWQKRGTSQTTLDLAIMSKTKINLLRKGMHIYQMIDFYSFENRVLTWGNVETQAQKDVILSTIRETPKVKEVIDCLKIGESGTGITAINDKWITTKANIVLSDIEFIPSRNYKIMTHEGNIYVMGIASNEDELAYALNALSYIKGVKKVISFVRIESIDKK